MNYHKYNQYSDIINTIAKSFGIEHTLSTYDLQISGSTILNIIKDPKNVISSSDLDLYYTSGAMTDKKLGDMILEFMLAGYYTKTSGFDVRSLVCTGTAMAEDPMISTSGILSDTLKDDLNHILMGKGEFKSDVHTSLIKGENQCFAERTMKIVEKILPSQYADDDEEINEYKYFSLAKYIRSIIRLYNPLLDKEIDLIVMKEGVKLADMIMQTFDYDIVKNYASKTKKTGKWIVYTNLPKSALLGNKKVAKMTIEHFSNRVASNLHEFNNFVSRYAKYAITKKYEVYIGNFRISPEMVLEMHNIAYSMITSIKTNIITKLFKKHDLIRWSASDVIMYGPETEAQMFFKKGYVGFVDITLNSDRLENFPEEVSFRLNVRSARLLVDERAMNQQYQERNAKGHIIGCLVGPVITEAIASSIKDEALLSYLSNFSIALKDKNNTEVKVASKYGLDLCCVCREEDLQMFGLNCGHKHSACSPCLKELIKHEQRCPMCRNELFSNID